MCYILNSHIPTEISKRHIEKRIGWVDRSKLTLASLLNRIIYWRRTKFMLSKYVTGYLYHASSMSNVVGSFVANSTESSNTTFSLLLPPAPPTRLCCNIQTKRKPCSEVQGYYRISNFRMCHSFSATHL